jgi:catechol 2,3-dioxygenase-like lactoylglutathione lyase family enzyme
MRDVPALSSALRLSRLSLGVSDLDASERFYRDVLGLQTERHRDDVVVRWPGFSLVLVERPPSTRGKFNFGFAVGSAADVDAWASRLREHGVEILSGPSDEHGERRLFLVDPDNYEIQIVSN